MLKLRRRTSAVNKETYMQRFDRYSEAAKIFAVSMLALAAIILIGILGMWQTRTAIVSEPGVAFGVLELLLASAGILIAVPKEFRARSNDKQTRE